MSENKTEGKTLFEIYKKFREDKDTFLFNMVRAGTSSGATDKKQARISIKIPFDICNNKNRNLGEIDDKYFGIMMFIPKKKVEKFIKE